MCDLMDALEAIDGSLYRAWMAEHEPLPDLDSERGQRRALSYVSWSQSQMLLLELANSVETLRVTVTRALGDRKSKPVLLYPPGSDSGGTSEKKPSAFSTAGMSFDDITGMLSAAFGGG